MKETLGYWDNVLIKVVVNEETKARFHNQEFDIAKEAIINKDGETYLRGEVEKMEFDSDSNPVSAIITVKTGTEPVKITCSANLSEIEDISIEPGVVVYNYLFNYFGGQKFKDKVIGAASIDLAIHCFRDGKEVKFEKEPKINNRYYLCDIFKVSFDREKLFVIDIDEAMLYQWRVDGNWSSISAEVVGYTLDYIDKLSDELVNDMPEEMKKLGTECIVPMEVSEEEFKEFLQSHLDDFDISDNRNAQVPSSRIAVDL